MSKNTKKIKLPPTLIIGLGGTGCDIISRVEHMASEEQKKYLRFVHFDTDANELRVRKQESPQIFTVQTSRRMTVSQALRIDLEARNNSFPASFQLLSKPLTEGAGQVRAVSKLAFDTCLREGRIQPLHDAINQLQYLNGDTLEQSMRVVIVTTLVGGTGSGILLPVAMYLRNYLENICQKKPIIRGICVLPDVFFHGSNKPEVEKENLRTNAYAALRELDAFMLKADNPKAYADFKLVMPTPGTVDKYDEYAVSPMDFCFLFDGQNMSGDGLQNLEAYKNHIANCVFTSSVSVLNKRLNSSEDNTILQRCAENGRNRYCGIGTSKIVYPFEHVRDYLAMTWMAQAMTDEWLRFDKAFEEKVMNQQKSRKNGHFQKPVERRPHYCESIKNAQCEGSNYFAKAIYNECYLRGKDEISLVEPKWMAYYTKLKEFIDARVSEDTGYAAENIGLLDKEQQKFVDSKSNLGLLDRSASIGNFIGAYDSLERELKTYFSKTKQHAEAIAQGVADSLFAAHNYDVKSEHHIEHWLMNNGDPLHPNSARFFLYSLELFIDEELQKLMASACPGANNGAPAGDLNAPPAGNMTFTELSDSIKNFYEAKKYPISDGNGRVTDVDIRRFVNSISTKDGSMIETKMTQVMDACAEQRDNIERYYGYYLQVAILTEALQNIKRINSNYELFYGQLDSEIKNLPARIKKIKESFANDTGNPIIYVCASKTCLEGLEKRCPNTVDPIQLTPEFKRTLLETMYKKLNETDPEKHAGIISELISKGILEFWRGEVIKQYGNTVDMDIIDALLKEAELEAGHESLEAKRYYIEDKYESAMKLAEPFIDRPIGQQPYIIDGYSINPEVKGTEDIQKSNIIEEVFSAAECDGLMDKYQILFMKALYNLKIADLPKFAPEDTLWVDPLDAGTYFKAYWKRINEIIPDDKLTRTLTPHLDKRWHFAGLMPDLSEKAEQMCLDDAKRAFFISLVYNILAYDGDQYRFKQAGGGFMDENIVVGDGKCNKFNEIYEAMRINRPLVRTQLEYYKTAVREEKDKAAFGKSDYTKTDLYVKLKSLTIEPYFKNNVSFFEIPVLYKATSGGKSGIDSEAIGMFRNSLKFLEEYLVNFYSDKLDLISNYVKWLSDQTVLFCDNLKKYYGNLIADPFEDRLIVEMKSVLESVAKTCCMNCRTDDTSVEDFKKTIEKAFSAEN